MKLRPFIDEVASQADDILAGITNRAEARSSIAEFISMDYPKLPPGDRKTVLEGVMAILEDEGFFGERFVDSFDADQDPDTESDRDT